MPRIKKFSFEDNVQEGELASVTCLAVSSNKPLTFTWSKNGHIIKEMNDHVRIENSGEFSVLIVDNINLKSAGNYTCTATNPSGSTTHTAYLEVKGMSILEIHE